jgi:hypothetical protein
MDQKAGSIKIGGKGRTADGNCRRQREVKKVGGYEQGA